MKRVLLTGASGFVGRHTVDALLARDYEVHAVSSVARSTASGLTWHQANLLDLAAGPSLVSRLQPTHLLHLAWYAEPGKYWQSPLNLAWQAASLVLLEAFAANGGRRAVTAGTCAEYDWSHGFCTERVTPCLPHSLYGTSKHALAQTLEAHALQASLSSAWARLFLLYGPHEAPVRLVPSVIRSLLEGQPALCTHGRQLRDFLHVADVADALCALLDSPVEGPVNIASGQPTALADVVHEIAHQLERPDLVRLGALPSPQADPPLLVGNCARLRDEVGWQPRHRLPDGLADAVAWWREQGRPRQ